MDRIQPQGVFVVGVLTTLSALVILYLAFVALHFISWSIIVVLVGGFGVLLLADAVLIFRGVRVGWYLSIVLWVVLLSGLCILYSSLFFPIVGGSATFSGGYLQFVLYVICPLLYPAICLMYFLKENVKRYFGA
jgi:hypothetical protein